MKNSNKDSPENMCVSAIIFVAINFLLTVKSSLNTAPVFLTSLEAAMGFETS